MYPTAAMLLDGFRKWQQLPPISSLSRSPHTARKATSSWKLTVQGASVSLKVRHLSRRVSVPTKKEAGRYFEAGCPPGAGTGGGAHRPGRHFMRPQDSTGGPGRARNFGGGDLCCLQRSLFPVPLVRHERSAMQRSDGVFGLLLGAAALLLLPGGAAAVVNPHDTSEPQYCLNCHTAEIYEKTCDEGQGYCLLAGSVDAVCLMCHIKEDCCRVGQEHLPRLYLGHKSHPTDLDTGEITRAYVPESLPVHQGRITCRTCHLHRRERPEGYKMLRLVDVKGTEIDWTVLCHDCHKER
jgi:hypothetical protein